MIDPSLRAPDSSLSRRIRRMVALDPDASALFFGGLTFPWSFYSDAVADLETLLAAHPAARRVGIVLRNRPGPLVAMVATLGTGREVVTLSPHLGDIGLQQDIVELAPDVVVAEDDADPARLGVRREQGVHIGQGIGVERPRERQGAEEQRGRARIERHHPTDPARQRRVGRPRAGVDHPSSPPANGMMK